MGDTAPGPLAPIPPAPVDALKAGTSLGFVLTDTVTDKATGQAKTLVTAGAGTGTEPSSWDAVTRDRERAQAHADLDADVDALSHVYGIAEVTVCRLEPRRWKYPVGASLESGTDE